MKKPKIYIDCSNGVADIGEWTVPEELKAWRLKRDEAYLRVLRDVVLGGTDWTMLSDIPLKLRNSQADYRQRLREWPETEEFKNAVRDGRIILPPSTDLPSSNPNKP
jgi:hypothetical protein